MGETKILFPTPSMAMAGTSLPDSFDGGGGERPLMVLTTVRLGVIVPQPDFLRFLVPVYLDVARHQHLGRLLYQHLQFNY